MTFVLSAPRVAAPSDTLPNAAPPARANIARWLAVLGLAVMLGALAWLARTLYALPPMCQALWWGINPLATPHWASHLGIALPPPLSPAGWNSSLRGGLCLLWVGYGLLAWGVTRRGGALTVRAALWTAAVLGVAVAVLMPPVLSTDAYAYAATGRLGALYGQNPYAALPYTFLHAAGDTVQFFLAWDIPTVYGPAWTVLSMALVAALPHGSLWLEVLGMKLIEAAALWGMARGAARIAEAAEPGRGAPAAWLVGTCPLLLIEGPGSGHNDLLMMALLFAALAALGGSRAQYGRAGVWLGLAAGVKLLPLLVLPWLLWEAWRREQTRAERVRALLLLAGGCLVPLAVGYALFWGHGAVWSALRGRASYGHGTLLWAGLAYAGLTVWQWRQRTARAPWLPAWTVWSVVFMVTGLGIAFPWYIAWFWPMTALRGGRMWGLLFGVVSVFALLWECLYATLVPLVAR